MYTGEIFTEAIILPDSLSPVKKNPCMVLVKLKEGWIIEKYKFERLAKVSKAFFSKSEFDTTKSALVGLTFCPPPRLPVLILKYVSNSDFENCSPEMDALVRIDREITFASNMKYAMCEEK